MALPFLGSHKRIVILVKQEGKLEGGCVDQAGQTGTRSTIFARDAAKNCVGKYWCSNTVEADSGSGIWRRDTLGGFLNVGAWVHQGFQVHLEVLHGALLEAALAGDRLIAEIVHGVVVPIHLSDALFNRKLQVVNKLKIGLGKDVFESLVFVEGTDPASVDAEESAELSVEVGLLDVGARERRNPEQLGIRLKR